MAGFDAGLVVSPLDFSFEPYTKVKGRVPEPNDQQIADFMNAIKVVMTAAQKELNVEVDATDPVAMMKAVEGFDPAKVIKMLSDMADAYAALCSNKPSADQLLAVPLRVRAAFYAWIQNEVVNPEAGPGAGTASVIPLKREAAG